MIYTALLATYVIMHLSSIFVLEPVTNYFVKDPNLSEKEVTFYGFAWTLFLTNLAAAIIFVILVLQKKDFFKVFKGKPASIGMTVVWGFAGFFLAIFGQILAAVIEKYLLGIEPGSDNTALLSEVMTISPIIIISMVIFAPFLEEIIFRRVLFGGLYNKTNFWIAAIVSAVIFSVVHNELEHTLVYMAPAFAFAFVYYKSKRLLAPMIGHFLVNGYVVVIQLNYDKIMELQDLKNSIFIFFNL